MKKITEFIKKYKWIFAGILTAAILALPAFLTGYKVLCVDLGILAAMAVLGLVVLVGYTGQLSLGQIAYYAIGSYTVGILTTRFGISPWICIILAVFVAALFGIMVGVPAFSLRGPFLAIITIGFFEIVDILLTNLQDFTGGPFGISNIPKLKIGSIDFCKPVPFYYLTLALLVLIAISVLRLRRSRVGRAMIAVMNDETSAPMLGVNVKRIKLVSFGFAAALAGLAGGLYATFATYIVPEAYTYSNSALYLSMSVISGFNAVVAPFVAVILNMLPELLRALEDYYLLIFSVALMIVIMISAWRQYKANNDN